MPEALAAFRFKLGEELGQITWVARLFLRWRLLWRVLKGNRLQTVAFGRATHTDRPTFRENRKKRRRRVAGSKGRSRRGLLCPGCFSKPPTSQFVPSTTTICTFPAWKNPDPRKDGGVLLVSLTRGRFDQFEREAKGEPICMFLFFCLLFILFCHAKS